MGLFIAKKKSYHGWSEKMKHTLIFNELWKGICEGEGDNALENPTLDKELVILENKNIKAYALIVELVNEKVIHHIYQFSN